MSRCVNCGCEFNGTPWMYSASGRVHVDCSEKSVFTHVDSPRRDRVFHLVPGTPKVYPDNLKREPFPKWNGDQQCRPKRPKRPKHRRRRAALPTTTTTVQT